MVPTLSLCMMVKNEEQFLDTCLSSVAGVADEIILVDSYSTDRTLEIAAAHGARVIQHVFQKDFSLARNTGLEQARCDWILVLDADEALEAASARRLKPLLTQTPAAGLRLRQRNFTPPGELIRYSDLPITRLFRNRPEHRYEGVTHEQITPAILRHGGLVLDSDLIILHSGYAQRQVQGRGDRASRNLDMLEKAIALEPNDAYLHYQLGITYKMMNQNTLAAQHLHQAIQWGASTLNAEVIAESHMKLAQIYLAAEDNARALQHALACLRLDANNLVALYVAALAYMAEGQIQAAYSCFLRIRQSPPDVLNDIEDLDTILAYCEKTLGK